MIVQLCMNVLVESGDGMKHVFCRKSRNIIVRRWVSEQINHITPSSLSPLCLLPTFQYDRCMYSFQYREPKNPREIREVQTVHFLPIISFSFPYCRRFDSKIVRQILEEWYILAKWWRTKLFLTLSPSRTIRFRPEGVRKHSGTSGYNLLQMSSLSNIDSTCRSFMNVTIFRGLLRSNSSRTTCSFSLSIRKKHKMDIVWMLRSKDVRKRDITEGSGSYILHPRNNHAWHQKK